MLTEKKLQEKKLELKASQSAYIEWEEPYNATENPLKDGVQLGNFMPPKRFRLKQESTKFGKLYLFNEGTHIFESIMIVELN